MAKILNFLVAIFIFCGCDKGEIGAKIGEISPQIAAKNLQDKKINLNDFNTKLKIIVFWQYGCLGCTQILPNLENFIKNNDANMSVFAINSMNDKKTIQKFSDDLQPQKIQILMDELQISFERFELKKIPTILILDNKNKILQILSGEIPWDIVKSRILSFL